MSARFEPTPDDLALARAWGSAFAGIFTVLDRCVGFTLLPIVVPEARVARAIGAALEARGVRTTGFAPTTEPEWESFANFLLDPSGTDGVTMLVTTGTSDAQRSGLWLVNRQREAYLRTHPRPLLWCVDTDALRACSEEAPDLWSIQATPKFIRPPEAEVPVVEPGSRSLEALLALIREGTCADPAVWFALSTASEAELPREDAAYCAESAAFFSDGDAKTVALERAMQLRVALASGAEDAERIRALAERPTASALRRTVTLDNLTAPAARAVAAILAREAHARRSSPARLSAQQREAWLAEPRVGHRARANAIGASAPLPVRALRPSEHPSEWLRVRFESAREEQRLLVERLQVRIPSIAPSEPEAILRWEPQFVAALFDIARARVGASGPPRDRDAVPQLTDEEIRIGSPNALLLSLMHTRVEFERHERGDWPRRFETIFESSRASERVRARAALFANRSRSLARAPRPEIRPSWQHRSLELQLNHILKTPTTAAEKLRSLFANVMFDHERADAVERVVNVLLPNADRAAFDAGIRSVLPLLDGIAILGHRASALGSIARLVRKPSQQESLQALMRATEELAAERDSTLSLRDLTLAIRPVIEAAFAIGAEDDLPTFSEQIRAILRHRLQSNSRDGLRLRALLALAEHPRSPERTAAALNEVWSLSTQSELDVNAIYDVAAGIIAILRGLPIEVRKPLLTQLIADYSRFDDYFTTRKFYRTNALLIVEGVLDAATAPTPAMTRFVDRSMQTSAAFLQARR